MEKSGLDNPIFELGCDRLEKDDASSPQQSQSNIEEGKGEIQRAQWGNGLEFLMSCIAMSVGLGNIWRFPFTAYENGGGAFLIPYIIVLTVIGRPLYFMEMALGQFSSKGNVKFYKSLSPVLIGVGYGQVIASFCVATYYCSLMAITLFYLIHSFTSQLPWGECLPQWDEYLEKINKTCVASTNITNNQSQNSVSSSELYFTQEVLKETTDISNGIGLPEWRLTLCLLASWMLTFLVSIKGVKSSGKASYFLAIFPYVIMIALLIRGLTLEGASEGMYYFIKTDWSKLAKPEVWYAAVTQCFFSLNVGFGSIIMFSSYNDFRHNINRDALIVTTLDTFTSLLSGATIFGILGNLAHNLGVTPDKVINSGGTGLAFVSYPDAIAKFDIVPWLFAILFFFMLLVLGIGSLAALHGTINTMVQDNFPNLTSWKVSLLTSLIGFLVGLIYVTPGGQFMLNLVDYFGGTFIVFIFVVIEVIAVTWFYGLNNFTLDMEYMLKTKVGIYWRVNWGVITPVLLIVIFVYFLVKLERITYGPYPYSDAVLAFGWAILVASVLQIIFWISYFIYKNRKYGFPQMIYETFTIKNWGPLSETHREEWKKFKEDAKLKQDQNKSWFSRSISILLGRY